LWWPGVRYPGLLGPWPRPCWVDSGNGGLGRCLRCSISLVRCSGPAGRLFGAGVRSFSRCRPRTFLDVLEENAGARLDWFVNRGAAFAHRPALLQAGGAQRAPAAPFNRAGCQVDGKSRSDELPTRLLDEGGEPNVMDWLAFQAVSQQARNGRIPWEATAVEGHTILHQSISALGGGRLARVVVLLWRGDGSQRGRPAALRSPRQLIPARVFRRSGRCKGGGNDAWIAAGLFVGRSLSVSAWRGRCPGPAAGGREGLNHGEKKTRR